MEQLLLPVLAQPGEKAQMELSQDQSVALVEVFLNSSLACICYSRELLNWQSSCFRRRCIDDISLDCSPDEIYSSFIRLDGEVQADSQELRVLVRSQNHRANRILNMLEFGVFETVKAGYLDTLQVFITNEAQQNKSILEAYTYTFNYRESRVTGVDLSSSGETFTLDESQKSFKSAIRGLLRGMKNIPRLPDRCALGMSVAYTSQCPPRYEPAGFVATSFHSINPKHWDSMWKPAKKDVAVLDTTHHTVRVAAREFASTEQTTSQLQDVHMSKQLDAMQKTSSNQHGGVPSTLPAPRPSTKHRAEEPTETTSARKRKSQDDPEDMDDSKRQRLMPSSTEQRRAASSNPLKGLTLDAKRRRKRILVPEKLAELVIHAYAVNSLNRISGLIFDEEKLRCGVIGRIVKSQEVSCDCGYPSSSSDLLYCALCNTWQHSLCYGLDIVVPPDQHVCYSCLLSPNERGLLVRLRKAVYLRLALKHISSQETGLIQIGEQFEKALFGEQKGRRTDIRAILQLLHSTKVLERSRDGFAVVHNLKKQQLDQLKTEFLDPLAGIEHHYRAVRETDSTRRLKSSLDDALRGISNGRDYQRGDVEEMTIRDAHGRDTKRYGYFPDLDGEPVFDARMSFPRRRKLSISRTLIKIDRSSPESSMSTDEMVEESLNALDRDSFYGKHASSVGTNPMS